MKTDETKKKQHETSKQSRERVKGQQNRRENEERMSKQQQGKLEEELLIDTWNVREAQRKFARRNIRPSTMTIRHRLRKNNFQWHGIKIKPLLAERWAQENSDRSWDNSIFMNKVSFGHCFKGPSNTVSTIDHLQNCVLGMTSRCGCYKRTTIRNMVADTACPERKKTTSRYWIGRFSHQTPILSKCVRAVNGRVADRPIQNQTGQQDLENEKETRLKLDSKSRRQNYGMCECEDKPWWVLSKR
ncbi:hypothetical protein ILUMI_06959 [Ignelater luminosus]|uniref:Transposase Tc1-like domain-containing protein n=1 Tax=Ignelater luminosus TaxID=2038154 RepID=A0A8K0GEV0_IGNLU|nr:hypothetical protein ILUMI_06959 [Ignelater luminosus]